MAATTWSARPTPAPAAWRCCSSTSRTWSASREQIETSEGVVREIKTNWPKTLIFMVSSEFDAATVQAGHAMGVNGFIVKPFKADTVLNTIRNTVIAMVKRQRAALAAQQEGPGGEGADGGAPAAG